MQYSQVLQAVYGQPWAVRPEMLATVCEIVRFRAAGGHLSAIEIEERIGAAPSRAGVGAQPGAVAVLPVYGMLSQRMNLMTQVSGGTSTELLGKAVQAVAMDPGVKAIVLDVDSPGGTVFGLPELWQTIMNVRGQKPVVAVANSVAASGAYWLASAAQEIVVTPGGLVGSIGVIVAHDDISKAQEMHGVKTTLVSAGKRKAWGAEVEPLSEEGKAALQEQVDAYYAMFVQAVAKGRGVSAAEVRSGFGEGGLVLAKDAVSMGMADRVATLEEVVEKLAGGRRTPMVESQRRRALLLR